MKKTILISLLGFVGLGLSQAAPLTPDQALQRVRGSKVKGAKATAQRNPELLFTFNDSEKQPALYVFGGASEGYMILSADDVTIPMLGYADNGEFDADNMPPQMKWWLEQYERQITEARKKNVRSASGMVGIDPAWTAIEPLVKTKWDQDAPFNNDCPSLSSRKCYTGCVATAMAQVMNYWKYPASGTGRVVYKAEKLNKNLLLNFANQTFDWDNMLDVYDKGKYDDTQAAAVAQLMKCAGYGVEMNYGTDASGAQSWRIPQALKTYFSYDQNCRIVNRDPYSVTEWNTMVYENLKNVGPLVYDGQSIEGGHSFVCDGYDGNGYFHFNWGWSGMSDGYFTLNALDPSALGIGGGGGGFNFAQDIILGIQPPTGEPALEIDPCLYQTGSLVGSVSGLTLSVALDGPDYPMWMSYNSDPVTLQFGVICEPVDGTSGETLYFSSNYNAISFPGYGYGIYQKSPNGNVINLKFQLRGIQEGKYKVTLATLESNTVGASWMPVQTQYGCRNYIYLLRDGASYTVEDVAPATVKCESFTLETPLYANCLSQFNLKLANNTDLDLTRGVMPAILINGQPAFIGGSSLYVVGANSTFETSLISGFDALQGAPTISADTQVTIVLMDPDTYDILEGSGIQATMKKNPGNPTLSMQSIEIKGDKDGVITIVADKSKIEVNTRIKLMRGYFAYPLYALITDSQGVVLQSQKLGGELTFMSQGEVKEFSETIDFPAAEEGVEYPLYIAYMKDYGYKTIGVSARFKVDENSSVEDLLISDDIDINYDASTGKIIANSKKGLAKVVVTDITGSNIYSSDTVKRDYFSVDVSGVTSTILIVKVVDNAGKVEVKKIIR